MNYEIKAREPANMQDGLVRFHGASCIYHEGKRLERAESGMARCWRMADVCFSEGQGNGMLVAA